MPSPSEILDGLAAIAERGVAFAIAWHVVLVIAVIALSRGWRPSRRFACTALAAPLVPVAGFALAFGNWFNGAVFASAAIALAALALGRNDRERVAPGPPGARAIGAALIAFGWVYPHFLAGPTFLYVIAAPVGLVPCPTLAVVTGLALLGDGLGARTWSVVVAALGAFYGAFGVLRLGVALDLPLVFGAVTLGIVAPLHDLRSRPRRPVPAS
jgi:hypothetical protein